MTEVARTPSSLPSVVSTQTLAELELEQVLDVVARFAVSELGAASVCARRPSADLAHVREELAGVGELARVLDATGGFTPRAVPDLSDAVTALATPGSVLEAHQLVELGSALGAMREVAAQLRALESDAPRAARLATELPPRRVEDRITRALEPDGRVRDGASPGLARARRRARETRRRLVAVLERIVGDLGSKASGADAGVTLRGGRYVIPVRREARGAITGIVHGESSSGATLFLEPAEVVELGNALAAAEAEELRETLAVLRSLTDELRPFGDRVEAGWRMCIAADDLYARARYALATAAAEPVLRDAPAPLSIRRGAHPLLLADAPGTVRFDLELADDASTVVVSGPNAGGKTVFLKAVGVLAAMAQSGIIPPVGAGTALPVFRRILSDIGDHQSIAESLSTFSAHVTALKRILEIADGRTLVLLDELGGGTDPVEGAALAGAVVLALNEQRAVTVASTHLGELKELAARTTGMLNASFEFDAETLAPTYRLIQGKPGRSYGLAIARRHGLPAHILATADALTPAQARTLDATLAALERRETELRGREAAADLTASRQSRQATELETLRSNLERRLAELIERERELERSGREQARRFLLEARRRVEEALSLARAAVSEATAKEARRLVEEGVRREADALRSLERAVEAKGWRIKGRATGDAERVDGPARPGARIRYPEAEAAASEIDLRGKRVDEAEGELLVALDAAVVADLPALRIIHGKGTGALRDAVQQVLGRDPRVASYRLAPPREGGSGVTIAELRR